MKKKLFFTVYGFLFYILCFSQSNVPYNYYAQTGFKDSAKNFISESLTAFDVRWGIGDDGLLPHTFRFINNQQVQGVLKRPFLAVNMSERSFNFSENHFQKSISKNFPSIFITDTTDCTVIAMGIHPSNASQYKYRVVEDDTKEIQSWTSNFTFEKKANQKDTVEPYAVIGIFNKQGKSIFIEVQKKDDYAVRDGYFIKWGTYSNPELDYIEGYSKGKVMKLLNEDSVEKLSHKYEKAPANNQDYRINIDDIEMLTLYLKAHPFVPYNVSFYRIIKADSTENIFNQPNFYGEKLEASQYDFSKEGDYEILISTPNITEDVTNKDGTIQLKFLEMGRSLKVKFKKKPPPKQTSFSVKQVLQSIAAIFIIVAVLFYALYRTNKRKLAKQIREKETIQFQLRSLRNQLNPHFIFNALSGIQNLITKKNVPAANHYLTQFALLTRTILASSEDELISIEEEVKMLDAYLQMEQLRFAFNYSIKTDCIINIANTDIPTMLLQPFVENAVKHGIASLKEGGNISINFVAAGNLLQITIIDNGSGFKPTNQNADNTMMGLKMSKEKISLLNEVYGTDCIKLSIDTTLLGTQVTISFHNWLTP